MLLNKTNMKLVWLAILQILVFYTKAQTVGKEAWHWQFGNKAALDFSQGSPPIVGVSAMIDREGCASISDPNTGALLFYTDGDSVWDRNNNRMPNGIGLINGEQGTTTQAATIVPKPGCTNVYYIITACDEAQPNFGIYYSIVDMNLNGGLGDVTVKNVLLTAPPTTEKVVATRHCNGVDYWILTHPYKSNKYNAYLVTSSGINLTPIVSSVGTPMDSTMCCLRGEAIGYLKVSPNGKKLAACINIYAPNPFIEMYDFDNSTGQVSNPITIPIINNGGYWNGAYGCTFSPNNKVLYVSIGGDYVNCILQFDLSSGVTSTIIASCDTFQTNGIQGPGAMQLASDGKIYITYWGQAGVPQIYLGIINAPDSIGNSCNYQTSVLTLTNNSSAISGLPNFIDGGLQHNNLSLHDIVMCNSFVSDTADAGAGFVHYYWSTGDTTQKIIINSPGKYWVDVKNANGCIASDTLHAYIITPTNFDLLKDTVICTTHGKYFVNAYYNGILSYHWSDGSTMPANTYTNSGTYWVDYTLGNGCVIRDSFKLIVYKKPPLNIGRDSVYCGGVSPFPIVLNAGSDTSYHYLWSTGDTSHTIIINNNGTYSVSLTPPNSASMQATPCGNTSDNITLVYLNPADPQLVKDTFLCGNNFPVTLSAQTYPSMSGIYYIYTWTGGHVGNQLTVNNAGTYKVTLWVRNAQNQLLCKIVDTVNVYTGCSGIENYKRSIEYANIYPNPNNGNMTIEYTLTNNAQLIITDVNGKKIGSYILDANVNNMDIVDDKLTNGVYFYTISNEQCLVKTGRIIVIK